jgi:hypothetical protein
MINSIRTSKSSLMISFSFVIFCTCPQRKKITERTWIFEWGKTREFSLLHFFNKNDVSSKIRYFVYYFECKFYIHLKLKLGLP